MKMYSRVCDHVDKLARHEMGSRQSSPYSSKHTQTRLVEPRNTPTGTCASAVTGNSFTKRFGGTPAFLKWPSICLVVVLAGLSEAATCTA